MSFLILLLDRLLADNIIHRQLPRPSLFSLMPFPLLFFWLIAQILCSPAYGDTSRPCDGIVSLAPSLTEVLYQLGLGPKVLAVTRYDSHPPEVEKLPRIGGFLDPATEAIIALRPSIVFGLGESPSLVALLARFGVGYEKFDHNRLQGLHESILRISQICGVSNQGHELIKRINREVQAIRSTPGLEHQPRVLAVVGREEGGDSPEGFFVSGSDGFYADIIELAGGKLAFQRKTTPLVGVTDEGIFALNPEIIIEFVGRSMGELERQRVAKSWTKLQRLFLKAGRRVRIEIIDGREVVIPGPRYPALIRRVRELLSS